MFDVVRKGFDRVQVTEKIIGLTEELATERQRAAYAEQELRQAFDQIRELEQAGGTVQNGFGDRVEKILVLAEQEAAEITDRAEQHAKEILERARIDAEAQCREVEKALVSQAVKLDQEAAARSAGLQRREDEVAGSEAAALKRAEELRTAAERDTTLLHEQVEAEVAQLRAQAKAQVLEDREKGTRELARLVDMQDGVRTEMDRIHQRLGELREVLTAELATPAGLVGKRPTAAETTGSADPTSSPRHAPVQAGTSGHSARSDR